jgi:D-3-phosphoglycerate dehydrogenase
MNKAPSIVVTDYNFPDLDLEMALSQAAGCTLVGHHCSNQAELVAAVAGADAVITQFARIDATVIGAMARARAIVRYGIGVDNVDLDAARALAIPVSNIPDYCIDEVADHTLAFILGLTRQVVTHSADLRAGQWRLAVPVPAMRVLRELTVGVLGFGRIGREVARRLLPFKCRLLVHDPVVRAADILEAGATVATLDEIIERSDLLTLHCPSTPATRGLIGAAALGRMKRGALLVNVARGDLVETQALVEALKSGQLAGAALDVFSPEPLPLDHALRGLGNVIVAPHIASVSATAVRALREGAARRAVAAALGQLPPNVVNSVTVARQLEPLA